MKSRRVIIEITPSRLEFAVVHGDRVVASSAARFDRSDWPADWRGAIDSLAAPLADFVTEHKVLGWPALVICRMPTSVAHVSSVPTAAPVAQHEQSARLAAASGVDGDADAEDAEVLCVGTDDEASPNAQRHLLAYAEADETLVAIESLLTQCRLKPAGCVPLEAVTSLRAAQLAQETVVGSRAVLWIGDHSSMLAVTVGGDLRFVRPIGVGIETFVDALTRPLRRPGDATASVCLPRREARRLLTEIGVPTPDGEIAGLDGFSGASILPLLQPLIQRLSLEVKQSLRYSMTADARALIGMTICGPGAAIAGLPGALTLATSLASDGTVRAPSTDSSVAGAIAATASSGSLTPLRSRDLRQRRTMSRTRHAILAGVAVALAYMGIEWLDARSRIDHLRSQAEAARQVEAERRSHAEALAAALADMHALQNVRDRIHRAFADAPEAPAVVAAIAGSVPANVVLAEVELSGEGAAPKAMVRGRLALAPGVDAGGTIRRFVASLDGHPLVSQARLARTSRVHEQDRDLQSFEIAIDLVPIPSSSRVALGRADGERSVP